MIVDAAASAVAVALILTPAPIGFSDRAPGDARPPRAPAVASPPSELPAAVSSSELHWSATRPSGGMPLSSFNEAIGAYAPRVEDATGRVFACAQRLIDRFEDEAIVRTPKRVDSEPAADPAPISSRPRIADSP